MSFWTMIARLDDALFLGAAACFAAALLHPHLLRRRWLNGRYISRPLVRLIGRPRATRLRIWISHVWLLFLPFQFIDSTATVTNRVANVWLLVMCVWMIDDFLTGGDDGPKKRRAKARNRLKMPRLVHLRPVERY